ncbi:LOW QUALITY PROTEIN: mitochondrial import inner membrane translocase subunit Tim29-like [Gigantopelta aegis]|uniref:LOW QUALITY PROTEIN: mitochondrial import inner membrane translocase subunit Tim29-like n=1 Tax=Gigantopelta aegis TaxID=1735272 RepID=UPI001B88E42A|nr:LOW QUALITY PROTEIN: mitochondrial import inner membrane translocase subunit Tim29-like [Gigantopelta aegis]
MFCIKRILQLGKPRLPQQARCLSLERLKGGRMERIGNYFLNILNDYKQAFVDLGQDMKSRPIKSGIYLGLLGAFGVLVKTKPSVDSYNAELIEKAHDLLLIGDLIRNKYSDEYLRDVVSSLKDGRLRFLNLGVCRVVWRSNYSSWVKLYDAQCKQLKPRWTEFHKQVVDIGVCGRWIYLDRAMEEYDVSEDEWKQTKT